MKHIYQLSSSTTNQRRTRPDQHLNYPDPPKDTSKTNLPAGLDNVSTTIKTKFHDSSSLGRKLESHPTRIYQNKNFAIVKVIILRKMVPQTLFVTR